jgi:hypothetical protein
MKQFDQVIQITLAIGMLFTIPLTIRQGIELVHPGPEYEELVTARPGTEEYDAQKKSYDIALANHNLTIFFTMMAGGALALSIGIFTPIQSVGLGLTAGGVASGLWGTFFYWSDMSNLARFIALIFFLSLLIILSTQVYRRMQR